MISNEKIFVNIPIKRSAEVISLLTRIRELSLNLEEAERIISEQEVVINKLIEAMEHKKLVSIYSGETKKRIDFDLREKLPLEGESNVNNVKL